MASSAFLTLIPHRYGSWTATQGDFYGKVETVIGTDGAPVRFADEDAACRWAWQKIESARSDLGESTKGRAAALNDAQVMYERIPQAGRSAGSRKSVCVAEVVHRHRAIRKKRARNADSDAGSTVTDFDQEAPGLSAEERKKAQAAMDNLRRRQAEGDYRSRPSIPEKADSMLPGIVVTRQAPGPAETAETAGARIMDYEHLQSRIRERVGPDTVPHIVSMARDGHPIPTALCLVQHTDGSVTVTRGDLRTIASPVLDAAGLEMRFADEQEACAWAWSDLEPELGETPSYSAADEREALASGDRQRARWEHRLREWKTVNGGTAE